MLIQEQMESNLQDQTLMQQLQKSKTPKKTRTRRVKKQSVGVESQADTHVNDIPIEEVVRSLDTEEQTKKRAVSKRRVDKMVKAALEEYKESFPEPRKIIMPTPSELKRMIKPPLRILDRLGLLDEDLPDSPLYDVVALVLGIGLYGYRVSQTLTLLRNAEAARTVESNGSTPHFTMGTEWDTAPTSTPLFEGSSGGNNTEGTFQDLNPEEARKQQAINDLLAADYEGRQQRGLL